MPGSSSMRRMRRQARTVLSSREEAPMYTDALPIVDPMLHDVPAWRRILLIEDDPGMRALLAEVLREEGYAVDSVADGARAAEVLFLYDALPDYDLIVSDVRLPGMSGVELASHISEALGPPVLLLSAFATPQLVRAGVAAGAVDVVAKPFDLRQLLATLKRLAPPDLD